MTSKASPRRPTTPRSERTSRFLRTHNPLQPPQLRLWHLLLGLGLIGWFGAAVMWPALAAELGRANLQGLPWKLTVLWIEGIAVICLWALVLVRAMHPLMFVVLSLEVVFLALWLGITRTERLEFTVVNLTLLVLLTLIPVRIITRPNEQDQLEQTRQERDAALARLAQYESSSSAPPGGTP